VNVDVVLLMTVAGTIEYEVREVEMGVSDFYGKLVHRYVLAWTVKTSQHCRSMH